MITKQVKTSSDLYKHIVSVIENYGSNAKVRFDGKPYRIVDAKPSDNPGHVLFKLELI